MLQPLFLWLPRLLPPLRRLRLSSYLVLRIPLLHQRQHYQSLFVLTVLVVWGGGGSILLPLLWQLLFKLSVQRTEQMRLHSSPT